MPANAASPAPAVSSSAPPPPGPRGLPLLGSLFAFGGDPLGFLTTCARDYGGVAGFRIGPQRFLALSDPAEVERVLVKEHREFPKSQQFWRQVKALFGNGLLISDGPYWQRQRRLAAPAFAGQRLTGNAAVMVDVSERAMAGWRTGEPRDLHTDMMALMLRVAAKTMFGSELEDDVAVMEASLNDALDEVAARVARPFVIPDAVPLPGHVRYQRGIARMQAVVERVIQERRAAPGAANDLLSALMSARDEDGSAMTDVQLRDEVINFLLAGHETTALVLSWTIHLLTQHPEIDARLAEEARAVLGDRSATIEDMPRLRFTEHVITESMRLYPPAWALTREPRQDCTIGGYRVRAGTSIWLGIWVLHRDPRVYDAPEEFRPDRWADGLAKRIPRFSYMPFGGGPRICIGNRFGLIETVLILATLVRRYRFAAVPDRPVVPFPSITLRPKGGVWARLEEREA